MKLLLLLGLVAGCVGQSAEVAKGLQVLEVAREVDARTQILKETRTYTLKNAGSASVSFFLVGVAEEAGRVAHVAASKKGGAGLSVAKASVQGAAPGQTFYKVSLSIAAGAEATAVVELAITGTLSPHPKEIAQAENQFVVLETSSRTLSPYPIAKDATTVKLPAGKLESFTKDLPSKSEGQAVNYGPYENVAAFSHNAVKVHMENNSPFLVVNRLERVIEISNWGNIAVEETVFMSHAGAKLKGPFSRFDFQRDRRERMPAVQSFKTLLPAAARDVYYRDEIGNISTSNLREMREAVELEIKPRFPLFGGWKSNYYIGYNVPSYEYLYSSGSDFLLKMRFLDHVYDNMVVEELEVKVILPEHATKIKLTPPYAVERSPDTIHATYLDTAGRPVVIAKKRNLVEAHVADFELSYTFQRMSMVREPLMLIVAFYCFFLLVIVYVRLDFTIATDPGAESRLKVAGLVEQITSESSDRQSAYDAWYEAVGKFKTSKDSSALNAARKKAENDLKTAAGNIAELQAQLKADSPDVAEKLSELTKGDKTVRELLAGWTATVERAVQRAVAVQGKLGKAQLGDAEKQAKAKLDDVRDKMDQLLYSL